MWWNGPLTQKLMFRKIDVSLTSLKFESFHSDIFGWSIHFMVVIAMISKETEMVVAYRMHYIYN